MSTRAVRGRWLRGRPRSKVNNYSLMSLLVHKVLRLKEADSELRRRELVLAVMLVGLSLATLAAFLVTLINSLTMSNYQGVPPVVMLICLGVFLGLYWMRYINLEVTSQLFAMILMACGLIPLVLWGVALPQGLLTCALAITVAGIILRARQAIALTLLSGLFIVLIAIFEVHGIVTPRTEWHHVNPNSTDAVIFAVTFAAIAMVSWLSHRQTTRSLYQAKMSERALMIERNSLERKVQERTRELERTQLEQMLQLQRFAEFGRVSSGLVHDIVNPLTAVSLNLDQVSDSEAVRQAKNGLSYIERYVEAIGNQLRNSSVNRRFVVAEEIEAVLQILEYRRRQKGVVIEVDAGSGMTIEGDPVKFSQVVANLVVNAIDAYDEAASEVPARVVIQVIRSEDGKRLVMTVQDWGVGISKDQLKHVFEPFYSTKQNRRGIGIGLALAKRVIEEDFGGELKVLSARKLGTRFTVAVPLRRGVRG